jgi:hypothetical protein
VQGKRTRRTLRICRIEATVPVAMPRPMVNIAIWASSTRAFPGISMVSPHYLLYLANVSIMFCTFCCDCCWPAP